MRLKKGFTLAEVLIVLMVIGAIATMSIPSLMKGVTEAQWKTAYKKAYNAIVNLTAMERIAGQLPSTSNDIGVGRMFTALKGNLSVKDYAKAPTTESSLESEDTYGTGAFYTDISFSVANTTSDITETPSTITGSGEVLNVGQIQKISPWITTDDNISYVVIAATSGTCSTKAAINSAGTHSDAVKASCVLVMIDVNGLSNGPNKVEPQIVDKTGSGSDATPTFTENTSISTLTGDRYYVYIGNDGATAGSKKKTVTGRIVADMK